MHTAMVKYETAAGPPASWEESGRTSGNIRGRG